MLCQWCGKHCHEKSLLQNAIHTPIRLVKAHSPIDVGTTYFSFSAWAWTSSEVWLNLYRDRYICQSYDYHATKVYQFQPTIAHRIISPRRENQRHCFAVYVRWWSFEADMLAISLLSWGYPFISNEWANINYVPYGLLTHFFLNRENNHVSYMFEFWLLGTFQYILYNLPRETSENVPLWARTSPVSVLCLQRRANAILF